jgi:hypothetical protein
MQCHLDQQELARRAQLADLEIVHIETGSRIPKDLMVLSNLADALHLDREWFRIFAHIKANLFTNVLR